jgi:hypothetical protein
MTTWRNKPAVLAAAGTLAASGLIAATAPAYAATVRACTNGSLTVSHSSSQGAAGHSSFVLLFKNTSGSTCTLYGYPGLDALNASGHVLAHATRTLNGYMGGAHAVRTITVRPGHYASATSEWWNFNPVNNGACTFSRSVATTPANTTRTVRLAVSVSICRLQIHPTVSGATGQG